MPRRLLATEPIPLAFYNPIFVSQWWFWTHSLTYINFTLLHFLFMPSILYAEKKWIIVSYLYVCHLAHDLAHFHTAIRPCFVFNTRTLIKIVSFTFKINCYRISKDACESEHSISIDIHVTLEFQAKFEYRSQTELLINIKTPTLLHSI